MSSLIILTRPVGKNEELAGLLESENYVVHIEPLIEYENKKISSSEITQISKSDLVVFFSSQSIVSIATQVDKNFFVDKKIIVVGEKTKDTFEEIFNKTPEYVSSGITASDMFEEYLEVFLKAKKVALLQGNLNTEKFIELCKKKAVNCVSSSVYKTNFVISISEEFEKSVNQSNKYIFLFYSPSTFDSALKNLPHSKKILSESILIAIGPVTASAIEQAGYKVSNISKRPNVESVLEAIKKISSN